MPGRPRYAAPTPAAAVDAPMAAVHLPLSTATTAAGSFVRTFLTPEGHTRRNISRVIAALAGLADGSTLATINGSTGTITFERNKLI